MPVPGYDLRIVGDDGEPAAAGQVGELQIKGPTAAMGYWNNRDKTRDTLPGAVDREAATSTRSTRTAITCTPAAATTC